MFKSVLLIPMLFAGSALALDKPHINVDAQGEVWVAADKAVISMQVIEQDKDVLVAKNRADKKLSEIIAALKDQEIDAKYIQAGQLAIERITEYNRNTQKQEDKGFAASRAITLTLNNIENYPQILHTLVELGVNHMSPAHFTTSKYDALYEQAEKKAFEALKRKAKRYAQSLDMELGSVYSVNVNKPYAPRARMESAVKMKSDASVDVADAYNAGEIKISASINAVYLIE